MSAKMKKMELRPIGIIHPTFKAPAGMPIQPVFANDFKGRAPRVLNKI